MVPGLAVLVDDGLKVGLGSGGPIGLVGIGLVLCSVSVLLALVLWTRCSTSISEK